MVLPKQLKTEAKDFAPSQVSFDKNILKEQKKRKAPNWEQIQNGNFFFLEGGVF